MERKTRLLVPQDFVDRLGAGTLVSLGIGVVAVPIGLLVGIQSFHQDEPRTEKFTTSGPIGIEAPFISVTRPA